MLHYISILSTLIAFVFAGAVLNRYRYKRPPHLLFWGIGLALYGLGTLTEVWLSFAFHPLALKVWYLCGAMLTAAWLGQGTVFLLIRKPGVARSLAAGLVVVSLLAAALALLAPITGAEVFDASRPASGQYGAILGRSGLMVFLTILLNIYGTLTMVGGALYSGFLFWRKRVLLNRVVGNVLIALGALLPATAGSLVKIGLVDWLYISEFLGVLIMYLGFLQATAYKPARRSVGQPVSHSP
jgi:hypothetical protein